MHSAYALRLSLSIYEHIDKRMSIYTLKKGTKTRIENLGRKVACKRCGKELFPNERVVPIRGNGITKFYCEDCYKTLWH